MSLNGNQLSAIFEQLAVCAAAPAAGDYHYREIAIEIDDVDEPGGEGREVMRFTLDHNDLEDLHYALLQGNLADLKADLCEAQRRQAAGLPVDDVAHVMERTPDPAPLPSAEEMFA